MEANATSQRETFHVETFHVKQPSTFRIMESREAEGRPKSEYDKGVLRQAGGREHSSVIESTHELEAEAETATEKEEGTLSLTEGDV